jgi:hypothetical protein
VYRLEWTLDKLVAVGVPEETVYQFGMAGVYTWSLANGQLQFVGEFADGTRLECGGTYEITGHEVNLQRHPPCPSWLFTANWELSDAGLIFTNAALRDQAWLAASDSCDGWSVPFGLYALMRGWRGRIDATGRCCHGVPQRRRSRSR